MKQTLLVMMAALAAAGAARAGGFEKNVTWGAKYVGVGGAAVSDAEGSESVYFNPAGLAVKNSENGDVSLNFSPTFAKFQGPIVTAANPEQSVKPFVPVGGATASYHVNEKFGLGVGYYVAGGTRADFQNANIAAGIPTIGSAFKPEIKSNIAITEFALGGGYEVMPGLRLGAAWRIVHVGGDFYLGGLNSPPTAFIYTRMDEIKKTMYNGFRVGAEYEAPEKKWGVGAVFRNNVSFTADATETQQAISLAGGATTALYNGPGTVSSIFPWQLSIGGNLAITDTFRLKLEGVRSNYSRVGSIVVNSTAGSVVLPTNWLNQTNIRVGGEYTGLPVTLRAGYVYTSQVVPDDYARATFSSPGPGHTLAVGAGKLVMNNTLDLNGALETSFAKGTGGTGLALGEYKSSSYAIHLSGAYKF